MLNILFVENPGLYKAEATKMGTFLFLMGDNLEVDLQKVFDIFYSDLGDFIECIVRLGLK